MIQLVSQDRISDCTVEQIVGAKRVSEMIEEQVDIPVPEVAEQIVAMPVPWIREETGELIQLIPQGQISDRVSEQNICVAVPEIGNRTSKRLWSTFHKSHADSEENWGSDPVFFTRTYFQAHRRANYLQHDSLALFSSASSSKPFDGTVPPARQPSVEVAKVIPSRRFASVHSENDEFG